MKFKISDRTIITLTVLFICCIHICFGITDLDYFWQCDLGKSIVKNFDFYGINETVWGSLGISEYYDHEWFCNIMFYLLSLLGKYSLLITKLLICILVGIQFSRLILKDYSEYAYKNIVIFILLFINSMIFLKVKAYSISVVLFIEEILILEDYYREKRTSHIIKMLLLVILWNNIHSGSVVLFFVVAGVYWLCYLKDLKTLVIGGICVVSLLINPYGYKLVLFNILHNSDSSMHEIVTEWRGLTLEEPLGVVCLVTLALILLILLYSSSIRKSTKLLFTLFLVISVSSMRHFMYMIPIAVMIIKECDIKLLLRKQKMDYTYILFAVAVLFSLNLYVAVNRCTTDEYSMNYIDDSLKEILLETNSEDSYGLLTDHSFVNVERVGLKNFVTGAYPHVAQRIKDLVYLTSGASTQQIENIISYYDLSKFLFCKYNQRINYYLTTNPLYEYLSSNKDYIQLYDSEYLVYFVRKDVVE